MANEINAKTKAMSRSTAKRDVAKRAATRRPVATSRIASRIRFDERCGMIIDRKLWEEIIKAHPDIINGIYIDKNLLKASEKALLKSDAVKTLASAKDLSGVFAIQTKDGVIEKASFIEGTNVAKIQSAIEVKPVLEAKPGLTKAGATLKATAAKKVAAKKK
ncbi:MAG: hypothetical protein IJM92_16985 [Fibrobacter sp.]|uniref:hypothetical protein n=1 Tax=Fibrobacter sp. TaxID=35828 RepID=UPI0025C60EC9|nr:hypothetical protein [Fibrobacter sp.]MBQ7081316.1 hypothetical protein [Fibrobacter sp.]